MQDGKYESDDMWNALLLTHLPRWMPMQHIFHIWR